MFDSSKFDEVMKKLESLADEQLAADLLRRFSASQSLIGKLLLNRDESLDHSEWKERCDKANAVLADVLKEIDRAYKG